MNILKHIKPLSVSLKQNHNNIPHNEFNPLLIRKTLQNKPIYNSTPIISAVIIVLFNQNSTTYSILIKRSIYNGKHSGQIALPGGKFDDSDKSIRKTAIRELNEELGIDILEDKIIGELNTLYIPISNFKVFPFVAFIDEPEICINKNEVEECIIYPISDLLNPESVSEIEIKIQDDNLKAPAFKIKNHEVWGATSMILNDFKYRIHESIRQH